MKIAVRAVLLSSCLLSGLAAAQDDGFGDEGTTTEHREDVRMQMGIPGAQMDVKVKVRHSTTTSTSSSNSMMGETRPAAGERMQMGGGSRDCGTGEDPGCTMRRNGKEAMDAETFRGMMDALRNESNEITRADMAKDMIKNDYLTAKQFGLVLDVFENEIYKLDIAKIAAPHVVNPKHALGFSKKFDNGILGSDYTKVITSQR